MLASLSVTQPLHFGQVISLKSYCTSQGSTWKEVCQDLRRAADSSCCSSLDHQPPVVLLPSSISQSAVGCLSRWAAARPTSQPAFLGPCHEGLPCGALPAYMPVMTVHFNPVQLRATEDGPACTGVIPNCLTTGCGLHVAVVSTGHGGSNCQLALRSRFDMITMQGTRS